MNLPSLSKFEDLVVIWQRFTTKLIDRTVVPLFVDYTNQRIGLGTINPATYSTTSVLVVSGNTHLRGDIVLGAAGNGISVVTGTNATLGEVTLVAGTATAATTKVSADSKIFITVQSSGGAVGTIYIDNITAGTAFSIRSSNALETSTVAWWLIGTG